ncbi:MAG: glycosyl transferase family protein [Parcubacteria group bacterium Gr01-1014_38]|nr:MAG: glycosyl transferase family protein [Parcubacteria group bacterium Gr01-1014_38]
MNALELSLVIPTYNERENIARLVPAVADALHGLSYEIVIVDDRSPDGTGALAQALCDAGYPVRLVTKERKEGIGAALRVGYDESRGKVIASMDADLSFDPWDLLRLYARIREGYHLVVGSRHIAGSVYEASNRQIWIKRFVSRLGNRIVRTITGIPIGDFSANFRFMRRETWHAIATTEKTNALLFEMILLAYVRGYAVSEVPVAFHDRRFGGSKLRLTREIPKFLRAFARHVWRHHAALRDRRGMSATLKATEAVVVRTVPKES